MALQKFFRKFSQSSDLDFLKLLQEYEARHALKESSGPLLISDEEFDEQVKNSIWMTLCDNLCCVPRVDSDFDLHSQMKIWPSLGKFPPRRSKRDFSMGALKDLNEDRFLTPEMDVKFLPLSFMPNFLLEELLFDADAFHSLPLEFQYNAVLLMVDVSGYTVLAEYYNKETESGAEDLFCTLNNFMSNLAATLMSYGGDILSFAGDAYLCQFESKKELDLTGLVKQAFSCSVYIQTVLATNIQQLLRVKIGMALGKTTIHILGSPSEFLLFVASGNALVILRSAESFCAPGEIVLSEEAFQQLKAHNVNLYKCTHLDFGFVKVTDFGRNLNNDPVKLKSGRIDLFQKCNDQITALSKAFLIPILRDIKTMDQLNYLSEVSKLTIVFMMLPSVDVVKPTNLDLSLQIIQGAVKSYGGVLNKVLLFDKGCTFLVVFGFPGQKHLNDTSQSLLCAENVRQNLLKYKIDVSIGIASGTCFCGIVGHYQRLEYTVLGQRVNMACRLMTTYQDYAIVLDNETYKLCQNEFSPECFLKLEKRKLKGIEHIPTIYSFSSPHLRQSMAGFHYLKSIRDITVHSHKKILDALVFLKDYKHCQELQERNLFPLMIIQGGYGCGKTFSSLQICNIASKLNYQYVTFTVTYSHIAPLLLNVLIVVIIVKTCVQVFRGRHYGWPKSLDSWVQVQHVQTWVSVS